MSYKNNSISSDDPQAVEKLKAKLAKLERMQEIMKDANAIIRKNDLMPAQKVKALVELKITEMSAQKLLQPDFAGRVGFPDYALSNNNAEIRRIRSRLENQVAAGQRKNTEEENENYTYREDTEDNRIMFLFAGKPSDTIRTLLRSNGFKWSPTRGAWIRQWTANAIYAAKRIKTQLAVIA